MMKATSLCCDQLEKTGCWRTMNQLQTMQFMNTKLGIISMALDNKLLISVSAGSYYPWYTMLSHPGSTVRLVSLAYGLLTDNEDTKWQEML